MKTGLRKIAAATLALSMCIPSFAFAANLQQQWQRVFYNII